MYLTNTCHSITTETRFACTNKTPICIGAVGPHFIAVIQIVFAFINVCKQKMAVRTFCLENCQFLLASKFTHCVTIPQVFDLNYFFILHFALR